MAGLTAVDLFAGAGGLSLGLAEAGFEILAAVEAEHAFVETHRLNLPASATIAADIRDVRARDLMKRLGLRRGELDLLAGGPPCQGYSIIGSRLVHDERNDLFKEMFRLAEALRPKAVMLENVPGISTLANGAYLDNILREFDRLGYDVTFAELLAAQYGAPQMRWRMIFVGIHRDVDHEPGMGLPAPTHGPCGIGELVPNCTIRPEQMRGFVTLGEAIRDLPPVEAGQQVHEYTGEPATEYQKEMRVGLTTELWNHYATRLSPMNLKRIALLKPGEDWRSLPHDLLPASMQRAKRKDHTRRYRRMTWDGVPRSIITRFRDPKTGEYSHPEQVRTITIREAARLQGFPDRHQFLGGVSDQYVQVGNAVPVQLAAAVGSEIRRVLEGTAIHILNGQWQRRHSTRKRLQPSLLDDLDEELLA